MLLRTPLSLRTLMTTASTVVCRTHVMTLTPFGTLQAGLRHLKSLKPTTNLFGKSTTSLNLTGIPVIFGIGAHCLRAPLLSRVQSQGTSSSTVTAVAAATSSLLVRQSASRQIRHRWLFVEVVLSVLRAFKLAILFSPALVVGVMTLLFPNLKTLWYDLLVRSVEAAGPAFIKLGQWMTTRPDLFPPALCGVFERLQDDVYPHSFAQTKKAVEDAFSVPFFDLFEDFDLTPLGVGCVAQVHRAILSPQYRLPEAPTGVVAVKVLHQRAVVSIDRDLRIMRFAAGVLNFCVPALRWMGFVNSVGKFTEIMVTQLDLTHEAANMVRFQENFKDMPEVRFATPYYPLVSQLVLVESFEEGVSVAKFTKIKNGPWNHEIADVGLRSFLKMALKHNFVHADLHPGNIFVQLGDKQAGKPVRLVFLDCGLVSKLSEVDQKNFVDLFRAVAEGRGRDAAELMVERTSGDKSQMVDVGDFVDQMDALIAEVAKKKFSPESIYIGDVLSKVLSLVRHHRIPLETNTTNLIMGVIILEGIGRQLNPHIDIFQVSLKILQEGVSGEFEELDTWYVRWGLYARGIYQRVFASKQVEAQ